MVVSITKKTGDSIEPVLKANENKILFLAHLQYLVNDVFTMAVK